MLEVTLLGTGAFVPTKSRAAIGTVIRSGRRTYIVDCGEGFLRQLQLTGLNLGRHPTFFFSHHHADHLLGLPGFLFSLSLANRRDNVGIYASPHTEVSLRQMVAAMELEDRPSILWRTVSVGDVYEDDILKCTSFRTNHTEDSYGFIFEELPKRPFLRAAAEKLGVPPGPLRQELIRGKTIRLNDGQLVTPDDVLGQPKPGAKLVYISDTAMSPELIETARGADCLIVEATYLGDESALAFQKKTSDRSTSL